MKIITASLYRCTNVRDTTGVPTKRRERDVLTGKIPVLSVCFFFLNMRELNSDENFLKNKPLSEDLVYKMDSLGKFHRNSISI